MLTHRRWESLDRADLDWLRAKHHFVVSADGNPAHAALGPLIVWNDDEIAVGGGFPMHGHRDMEIITYVRQGLLGHRDTLGSEGAIHAGDIQVMSAGTGIRHAEFNRGEVPLKLYQIWLLPREAGARPAWDTKPFPKIDRSGCFVVLASGFASDEGALPIRADARVLGAMLKAGESVRLAACRRCDVPVGRRAHADTQRTGIIHDELAVREDPHEKCRIIDAAGQHAERVEAWRKRLDAGRWQRTEGRLVADDSAERSGAHDRGGGLRAERDGHHGRRHRRGRATRRPTRRVRLAQTGRTWIHGRSRFERCKLGCHRLAHHDPARRAYGSHRCRIGYGTMRRVDGRAISARHVGGVHHVFDTDGHPGERPRCATRGIEAARLPERQLRVEILPRV